MHRVAVLAICLCLLAQPIGASTGSVQERIDPDDVSIIVTVDEDGDAQWEIEYRKRLDSDEAEATFDDIAADIEANTSEFRERFHNRMNATAADAAERTGREMTITDVEVTADRRELPQEYGVVTYSFRWTNFAVADGDRLVVGDSIEGLFLDEQSSLTVEWPAGYHLEDAQPPSSSVRTQAVVWEGPLDFTSGEPRVVVAETDSQGDENEDADTTPLVVGAVVVGLLAILGVGAVTYRRRDGGEQATANIDTELLSNEEQVLELLAANDGRLKQQEIAERLDWSDTKTSDVLKRLRDDGEVESFRLGRENVIRLPDESNI